MHLEVCELFFTWFGDVDVFLSNSISFSQRFGLFIMFIDWMRLRLADETLLSLKVYTLEQRSVRG